MIYIDGSYGEGGGQILRTSLTLSILTGQPLQLNNIRANRPKPGLAAQHLTAVRAAATICNATLAGDAMGSQWLLFQPGDAVQPGEYIFDVAQARPGGSAGSASLVLQTILLPLAMAAGPSTVTLRGGTHVSWSPPFPYLTKVYLPVVAQQGIQAQLTLEQWGLYPAGGGEIVAQIKGGATDISPLTLIERREAQVSGIAFVANLPSHIPQRMADRARNVLAQEGIKADLKAVRVRANSAGAGIFVWIEYTDGARAGFTAYGRKGVPAERVAETVCRDVLEHWFGAHSAPVDRHLADQLIVSLAIADGVSRFKTGQITEHLRTNMWVVEQFSQTRFKIKDHIVEITPGIHCD